jgi:arsenite methyltransferase
MHVLDLGSGSGRDCYIAAALVGENGSVTGIDMTEQQLKIATDYIQEFAKALGYQPKMSFRCGYIENLEGRNIESNTTSSDLQ